MDRKAFEQGLKDEEAGLVRECGGIVLSGKLINKSKSYVHRVTDAEARGYHFSLVDVAVLEAHSGNPRVTRYMARMRGYELEVNDQPLPLLSSEVEDWADEKIQLAANFSACMRAFVRSQRTPRTLNALKVAAQRSYEFSGAILQNIRVIASKQRETA